MKINNIIISFKKVFLFVLAFTISLSSFIFNNKINCLGAGVVPYAIKDGKIYFYLGRDEHTKSSSGHRLWADFGGKFEPHDEAKYKKNKLDAIIDVAAREFLEESMGIFKNTKGEKLNSEDKIKNALLKAPYIENLDKNGNFFYGMFFIKVDSKGVFNDFVNKRNKLLAKKANNEKEYKIGDKKYKLHSMLEKGALISVDKKGLVYAVTNKNKNGHSDNLVEVKRSSDPKGYPKGKKVELRGCFAGSCTKEINECIKDSCKKTQFSKANLDDFFEKLIKKHLSKAKGPTQGPNLKIILNQ